MNKTKSDIKKFSPFHNLLINITKEHSKIRKIHLGAEYLTSTAFKKICENHIMTEEQMKENKENLYDKYCQVLYENYIYGEMGVEYKVILLFIHGDGDDEVIFF
jgi:CDP-diacylglycerol pyrophosphatase